MRSPTSPHLKIRKNKCRHGETCHKCGILRRWSRFFFQTARLHNDDVPFSEITSHHARKKTRKVLNIAGGTCPHKGRRTRATVHCRAAFGSSVATRRRTISQATLRPTNSSRSFGEAAQAERRRPAERGARATRSSEGAPGTSPPLGRRSRMRHGLSGLEGTRLGQAGREAA